MIIGLCGAARSGKDTAATMLGVESGRAILRVQIAGPLKAFLRDLFDWTEEHTDGDLKDVPDERYSRPCLVCMSGGKLPLSDPRENCWLCNGTGKVFLTPRHAMQQLGGEFAENTFPAVYATRAARIAASHTGTALITDCRFLRDIKAVKAVGGIIIEMGRTSDELYEAATNHASETARMEPEFQALVDEHVMNDGTLEELQAKAALIIAKYQTADEEGDRIKPGDWMTSARFGPCVCIEDRGTYYTLRYEATHQASGKTLWVGNADEDCTPLRPADDQSRRILTLTGPYGIGEGVSDPRMGGSTS